MANKFINSKDKNIIADGVFEGGGVKALGIIGALKYFEKCGYNWNRVAGTSAGAIVATLIIAGYNIEEIEKILTDVEFTSFLDREGVQKVPLVGTRLGLFKEKGMYSGEYFEEWIKNLLLDKGISKFKDVSKNGESKLKIIAADITRKKKLVLPDDIKDYGIDPMEFEICKAVRMSISIPFYFKPVEIMFKGKPSYIVDGGIVCNYPIDIFDVKGIPEIPTIGFKFYKSDKNEDAKEFNGNDVMKFLFDIANTIIENSGNNVISEENKSRSVFIPVDGVESTEFDISKEKAINLFKEGYKGAEKFIGNWNFKEYILKYRAKTMKEKINVKLKKY